jgi:hypothetical protein
VTGPTEIDGPKQKFGGRESKCKNLGSNCSKMEKYSAERREATMQAAEDQAREDLGANYELAEIGEVATVDRLLQGLAVEERVDAMIDKCLNRLLFLRGLKSLRPVSSSPPLQPVRRT